MYASLYLSCFLISSLKDLCTAFAILFAIAFISFVIKTLYDAYGAGSYFGNKEDSDYKSYLRMKPWAIITGIFFLIFLLAAVFIPNKSDLITYGILKQVDTYASTNPSSIMNPQGALSTIDETVKQIGSLFQAAADGANRALDLIPKK